MRMIIYWFSAKAPKAAKWGPVEAGRPKNHERGSVYFYGTDDYSEEIKESRRRPVLLFLHEVLLLHPDLYRTVLLLRIPDRYCYVLNCHYRPDPDRHHSAGRHFLVLLWRDDGKDRCPDALGLHPFLAPGRSPDRHGAVHFYVLPCKRE